MNIYRVGDLKSHHRSAGITNLRDDPNTGFPVQGATKLLGGLESAIIDGRHSYSQKLVRAKRGLKLVRGNLPQYGAGYKW